MERKKEDWMKDNCVKCGKDITQNSDMVKYTGKCPDCSFFDLMGYTWEENLRRLDESKKNEIHEVKKEDRGRLDAY